MKAKHKKLLGISIAVVIMLILLPVLLFVICWEIDHQAKLLLLLENSKYRLEVLYYPGGFGTNPEVRIFSKDSSGFRQLLLYSDGHDTAAAFFVDSVTAGAILYARYMTEPWDRYPRDTFYFKLDEEVNPVKLPGIAP